MEEKTDRDKLAGFFKLYRKLLDNELWTEKPFDRARAWIDLIALANHKDWAEKFGRKPVLITRGQVAATWTDLGERWGWCWDKVNRFFAFLRHEKMVKLERTRQKAKAIITICNYGRYQGQAGSKVKVTTLEPGIFPGMISSDCRGSHDGPGRPSGAAVVAPERLGTSDTGDDFHEKPGTIPGITASGNSSILRRREEGEAVPVAASPSWTPERQKVWEVSCLWRMDEASVIGSNGTRLNHIRGWLARLTFEEVEDVLAKIPPGMSVLEIHDRYFPYPKGKPREASQVRL